MVKGLDYRSIGSSGLIVPTPLYVSDEQLADVVLGQENRSWPIIRRVLEQQGMPAPRHALSGLYFLPAIINFIYRREGLATHDQYPDDGPDRFGP